MKFWLKFSLRNWLVSVLGNADTLVLQIPQVWESRTLLWLPWNLGRGFRCLGTVPKTPLGLI